MLYIALVPVLPYYFAVKGINVYLIIATIAPLFYLKAYSREAFILSIESTVDKAICLYALIIAMLSAGSGDVKNALTVIILMIAGKMMFDKTVVDKNTFLTVIDVILIVALVVTVLGTIESFTSFNVFKLLNTSNGVINDQERLGITRAKAFTYQAISYGNYLVMASGLCFYRMVMETSRRKHILFVSTYILIALNILCTASRSTIMIYFICQMIFLWLSGVRKFFKWIFIGAAGLLIFNLLSSLFGVEIGIIKNATNLVLAMFFESSQQSLNGLYESTNYSGVGNRIDLYNWVWSDLAGNRIFGMGSKATYNRAISGSENGYFYTWYKQSIENEYLNCLYHYGMVGMIAEIGFFLSTILYPMKFLRRKAIPEEKVGFVSICLVIFLAYYISFFAVMQSVEKRLFYFIVFLMLCYIHFDNENEEVNE